MSGHNKKKKLIEQQGCSELFMFEGVSPDPRSVVSKVWEIFVDAESKKTQLYADAHVKVLAISRHLLASVSVFRCAKA